MRKPTWKYDSSNQGLRNHNLLGLLTTLTTEDPYTWLPSPSVVPTYLLLSLAAPQHPQKRKQLKTSA